MANNLQPVSTPFEYCEASHEENLDVAMQVFEDDDTPVATIPMLHKVGGQYVGNFTPVLGKAYYVLKSVFTDNTYTTINNGYASGSESFTCCPTEVNGGGGGGGSIENDYIKMRVRETSAIKMVVRDDYLKLRVGC